MLTARLLLTAPPYLVAAILALCISRTSDRRPERAFHLLVPLTLGMVGQVLYPKVSSQEADGAALLSPLLLLRLLLDTSPSS